MRISQFILLLFIPSFLLTLGAYGQIGGEHAFEFTTLPASSRIAALGGSVITTKDGDVALAYNNPGVLNDAMHGKLSVGMSAYHAGIAYGDVVYGHHSDKWGTSFAGGLKFITYGEIESRDAENNLLGTFNAGEYALFGSAARQYDRYSYGATIKLLYGQLETYKSFAAAVDAGVTYEDTARRFTASIYLRNIGYQFDPYVQGNRETLPFDLQIGFSKRLKNMPLRLSVTGHNFFRYDIRYDDPDLQTEEVSLLDTTTSNTEKKYIVDKIARHFILGGEFYFGKALRVQISYNHQRRAELALNIPNGRKGLVGVGFGFGLALKRFEVNYGFGKYHIAGTSHHFTVSTKLSAFSKRSNGG